jgi:hypothetical protein
VPPTVLAGLTTEVGVVFVAPVVPVVVPVFLTTGVLTGEVTAVEPVVLVFLSPVPEVPVVLIPVPPALVVVFKPVPPFIVSRFLLPVPPPPPPPVFFVPVFDVLLVLLPPVNLSTTAFVPTPKAAPANALVNVLPSVEPEEDVFAVVAGAEVLAVPEPAEVKVFAGAVAAPVPAEVKVLPVELVNDGNLDEGAAVFVAPEPVEVIVLGVVVAAPTGFTDAPA